MQLSDSRVIEATPEIIWSAILDKDVLRACVPGCQEMTGTPEDGFDATVVAKVGPVKATFKGSITLSDMTAPEALTLSGEGKGGAAGFAKGGAQVRLVPHDNGTELHYDVEANVGGKLAQLGSRIVDGFAKRMADQFFTNLQNHIEGPDQSGPEADPEESKDGEKKGWFKKLVN